MRFTFLLFLALFVGACHSTDPDATAPQPPDPLQSTEAMARVLDSIARHANPQDCYHLNSARAAMIKQQVEQATDLNQKIGLQFGLCQELLNAGQLEEAIQTMEGLIQQLQGLNLGLTNQTKGLYELLAVAYLRLGERDNCVGRGPSDACILPLSPEAQHQLTTGSKKAIEIYQTILATFPDDYQSRWLMNLAYMTLGEYPEKVPTNFLIPPATFTPSKKISTFSNIAKKAGVNQNGLSGGTCMEDFNNDGLLDLFATSYSLTHQVQLFINQGNGQFSNRTEAAGLTGIVSGLNSIHADYNNDGWEDILVLRGGWLGKGGLHPNSLLQNEGNGKFRDVTVEVGLFSSLPSQTAAWADFNGDGYLDLFIGNESTQQPPVVAPCEFYVNQGDGTFKNMASAYGLDVKAFVKGVAWGDVNNDQRPDLYLSVLGGANQLWMNRGGTSVEDWKFEEVGSQAGVTEPRQSFPCWFWDWNNDGYQDLFVSGYDAPQANNVGTAAGAEYSLGQLRAERPRLYQNKGDGTFREMSQEAGLQKVFFGMGANFGDLDNDGFLDFYIGTGAPDFRSVVPNRMFRNNGGKAFQEVTMDGFGHIQKGHGIAFGDINNDGSEDIYCVMGGAFEGDFAENVLFLNPQDGSNNTLSLDLEGSSANRSAVGARIQVETQGPNGRTRIIYRTVSTGGSFGSSSLRQEIGLGDTPTIKKVTIIWPSPEQSTTILKDLSPGHYRVRQGAEQAERLELASFSL